MNSKDEGLAFIKEKFDYIDSITIVDNTGKIMIQLRYNPRFSHEENELDNKLCLNKNILEVFPSLTPETSTLLQVLKTGNVVFCENQTLWTWGGKKITASNINFPIVSRGKIIGAVELSKDITNIEKNLDKKNAKSRPLIEIGCETFNTGTAKYTLDDIITENSEMKKLKEFVKKISSSSSSVLIYGETGTGKELFAQAIHNESSRRNKPFIAVNCSALPESLFEGILFGTLKGAFTGAENKKGLFEAAHGGTIYLDEANSMPVNLQSKLLRTLQEGTILPLGGTSPVKVDVRVIASLNKDPLEAVKNGEMREDLFFRLNVINVKIPPLRNRPDDISVLTGYFIKKYNEILDKKVTGISKDVKELFLSYKWPGNVRELEHVIEAAMNIVDGKTIKLEHLPVYLSENVHFEAKISPLVDIVPLKDAVEQVERKIITSALLKAGGNVSKASKLLKIPRTTLQYKIEKYKIKA